MPVYKAIEVLGVGATVRVEAETVANQQAIVRCAAYRGAKGVGRNQTPVGLATKTRLFFRGERTSDAGVGEDRKHLAFEKAEAHAESIIGKHQLVGRNAAIGMGEDSLLTVLDVGNGRVFIKADIGRKAVGQALDQG
ncbi:hypothetical protein D9M70_585780 [compost metagenome]